MEFITRKTICSACSRIESRSLFAVRTDLSGKFQRDQLPGGPSILVFPCGTSVRPWPASSDEAASGGEDCFPATGSPLGTAGTGFAHPATTSSEARRMIFVTMASRKEATYYGRSSAWGVDGRGTPDGGRAPGEPQSDVAEGASSSAWLACQSMSQISSLWAGSGRLT